MKRLDPFILNVFLCGLPVLAGIALFNYVFHAGLAAGPLKTVYNASGFLYAAWMLLSVYLSVRLVLSGPFRDRVLARLTFMRERDERETLLTGRATKTTLMTSLAILIFLFCLSCFQVSFFKLPPDKALDGKTRGFTLGVGFSLLNESGAMGSNAALRQYDVFSYNGLPISSSAIILLLIAWQIVSYNCTIRRLTKTE
ncbi:MAG: hypothetical protein PHC90_04365 [Syntrophorhabdaceae bacterium]|nr:hypothetical protein [Syntrophorhabdaceae bacterium]